MVKHAFLYVQDVGSETLHLNRLEKHFKQLCLSCPYAAWESKMQTTTSDANKFIHKNIQHLTVDVNLITSDTS